MPVVQSGAVRRQHAHIAWLPYRRPRAAACRNRVPLPLGWSTRTLAWPTCPLLCRRYLVLFLKFIASVVPTIEYDYTMAAGAQQ